MTKTTFSIAANLANRRFLGIDQEEEFLSISKNRKLEIENPTIFTTYQRKIGGFNEKKELELFLTEEPMAEYTRELDFQNTPLLEIPKSQIEKREQSVG